MAIAHFGVAVAILGMASDSAFTREKLAAARPGERSPSARGWFEFARIVTGRRPQLDRDRGRAARLAGERARRAQARRAASSRPADDTNEAAIDTSWTASSTPSSASQDETGRWQLRLWWKPFVTLIWLGGVLIALGGLLALIGRLAPTRRQSPPARGEECA